MVLLTLTALAAAVAFWLWFAPLAVAGVPLPAKIYGLDEASSRLSSPRLSLFARAMRMCDADSYYVREDGHPRCLVLAGDQRDGGALGVVWVARSGDHLAIRGDGMKTLRRAGLAAAGGLGSPEPGRHLVLVVLGHPVGIVAIDALAEDTLPIKLLR